MKETYRIEADLKVQEEMLTELENQCSNKLKQHTEKVEKLKRSQEEEVDQAFIRRKKEVEEIEVEKNRLEGRVGYLKAYP